MIELRDDALVITFPEVHPEARLEINFQRTLRIPDDGEDYPLPPGLGRFPLRHVDDYGESVPARWMKHGGVMLPMYQSEALWLNFNSELISDRGAQYPFAIKVAAGKINAATGKDWTEGLHGRPQDYMVAPSQPWLDGYCVEKGFIKQFVAMPLGSGYSVEEQMTGEAEHGGLQIAVYPMKADEFEKRFPKRRGELREAFCIHDIKACLCESAPDMGLGMGGRMRQEIYEDDFGLDVWDTSQQGRCFVHIANSLVWRSITGQEPPTTPPTSKEYTQHGLPWFEYYDDSQTAIDGSSEFDKIKTITELAKDKNDNPLPENESVTPTNVVALRKGLRKGQVREGAF